MNWKQRLHTFKNISLKKILKLDHFMRSLRYRYCRAFLTAVSGVMSLV